MVTLFFFFYSNFVLDLPKENDMTKEEIIEMAKQAGFEEHQAKFDTRFEPFARLVAKHRLLNTDPNSFMSYQEGVEAGRFAEREACANICEEKYYLAVADAIRARGEQE
jgi:hypothetical protein